MRYVEAQSHITAEIVYRPKIRVPQRENPSTPENTLLDDVLDLQTRNWDHLWIDIGGEG